MPSNVPCSELQGVEAMQQLVDQPYEQQDGLKKVLLWMYRFLGRESLTNLLG